MAPDELKAAARWHVKDLVEQRLDELTLDVMPVGDERSHGARHLFVAAARSSLIRQRVELAAAAGIELTVVDIVENAQRNLQCALAAADGLEARATAALTRHGGQALLTICAAGELFYARRLEGLDLKAPATVAPKLAEADAAGRSSCRPSSTTAPSRRPHDRQDADEPRLVIELQRSFDVWERTWRDLPLAAVVDRPGRGHHVLAAAARPDARPCGRGARGPSGCSPASMRSPPARRCAKRCCRWPARCCATRSARSEDRRWRSRSTSTAPSCWRPGATSRRARWRSRWPCWRSGSCCSPGWTIVSDLAPAARAAVGQRLPRRRAHRGCGPRSTPAAARCRPTPRRSSRSWRREARRAAAAARPPGRARARPGARTAANRRRCCGCWRRRCPHRSGSTTCTTPTAGSRSAASRSSRRRCSPGWPCSRASPSRPGSRRRCCAWSARGRRGRRPGLGLPHRSGGAGARDGRRGRAMKALLQRQARRLDALTLRDARDHVRLDRRGAGGDGRLPGALADAGHAKAPGHPDAGAHERTRRPARARWPHAAQGADDTPQGRLRAALLQVRAENGALETEINERVARGAEAAPGRRCSRACSSATTGSRWFA
ncbi:MAG: hypothetical protein MZW92_57965 [Comamonadaceae bacterium]|nr:hypothetical protein [Comamonadaceae bacterium]